MADRELIVEFKPGVSEDEARKVAKGVGANVRRRMQSDPDRVLLLIRVSESAGVDVERKLGADEQVKRVEKNNPDYGAL